MMGSHGRASSDHVNRFVQSARANVAQLRPRLFLVQLLVRLLPQNMFNYRRAALYRFAGIQIGERPQIIGPFRFIGFTNTMPYLSLGDEVYIETPCSFTLNAPVRIGDKVRIGPEGMILTGTHEIGDQELRTGDLLSAPVEIGDGTWVGARVTIMPGVRIGAGCVVNAGAVVMRSMPDNSVIAGNPARVIRHLDRAAESDPTEAN